MGAMWAEGMLKMDIAAKLGKKPSGVAFHLRVCGLRSAIQQKLESAPLSVMCQFGLVYLMSLAAMKPELQEKTYDGAYRKALHPDTVVTPIKTVPEAPVDDMSTNA